MSLIYVTIVELYDFWVLEDKKEKEVVLKNFLTESLKKIELNINILKDCELISTKQSHELFELLGEINMQLNKILNVYK